MRARTRTDLGLALLELQPVQHALNDPHYSLTPRPVDSSWHHAGFTGVMAGFNPTLHTHFYAEHSAFARWLKDPATTEDDHAVQVQLAKEVLHMAHDYLHSWAYRALASIDPTLFGYGEVTPENLDEQAFVLVLTEAVAVVGLDYWYLCVADIDERCDVALEVGPRTVHYREQHLSEYRRANPKLTVQDPQFFHQILRLYCSGVIDGFNEQDLLDSPPLASWLIRELLISPRQRAVCRGWLGVLGNLALSEDELSRTFGAPSEPLRRQVTQLSELLWRKIKDGEPLFYPPAPSARPWRYPAGAAIDFRFANLQRLDDRSFDGRLDHHEESFGFYVDQHLSRYMLPEPRDPEALESLRQEIDQIKLELDHQRLTQLASTLTPVPCHAPDPAPLELLFVN